MSTSERSFNQVRAILNKLDRSIDEAREKRLQPAAPPPAAPQSFAAVPAAPKPAPAPVPASQYGRAQPLRAQPMNSLRWNP
jgi:hypothetical protein